MDLVYEDKILSSCKLSFEEGKESMKVYYDDEVDALYLKLGDDKPDGVIEISEGVNIDTTSQDKIVIPIQKEISVLCPDDLEILNQETT